MAFFEWLFVGGALAKEAKWRTDSKKKCAQMSSQGAFLPEDYKKHDMWYQDYARDWFQGEGKCVPKEYHAYFKKNRDAANKYLFALTSKKEVENGLQPVLHMGIYNKYTYDPFASFNSLYLEKIKIFNETGVYYW